MKQDDIQKKMANAYRLAQAQTYIDAIAEKEKGNLEPFNNLLDRMAR
jgi:hypothetical protein